MLLKEKYFIFINYYQKLFIRNAFIDPKSLTAKEILKLALSLPLLFSFFFPPFNVIYSMGEKNLPSSGRAIIPMLSVLKVPSHWNMSYISPSPPPASQYIIQPTFKLFLNTYVSC